MSIGAKDLCPLTTAVAQTRPFDRRHGVSACPANAHVAGQAALFAERMALGRCVNFTAALAQ
ncbi:hypothetical protein [Pandoraea commovens]|uniref:hypothetical protein n=1 Tax=Pandoraea commovens TaxID=2508289 RepID=UPI0015813CD8|nr:hypothetical protein [Pandoraea commovens]